MMQEMMMRGCFWGFLTGAIAASVITVASMVADPSPLSEGKFGATWIMLVLVFAIPGAVLGTIIGLVVSLFLGR